MPSAIQGDYSGYPEPIREVMPYLYGEVCELRHSWEVFRELFMSDQQRLKEMGKGLSHLLSTSQQLLQDHIILSISRLTDQDRGSNQHLSAWRLRDAIPYGQSDSFGTRLDNALDGLKTSARHLRTYRHKRIAHFDFLVSLEAKTTPQITFTDIRLSLEALEASLNLVSEEFEQTTVVFDILRGHDITGTAEVTCYKALAYDELERDGIVPFLDWKRRAEARRLSASDESIGDTDTPPWGLQTEN